MLPGMSKWVDDNTVVAEPRQRIRGAVAWMARDLMTYTGEPRVFEYLIDGPRGTSKTVTLGFVLRAMVDRYPGLRVLFVRKTRRSISESFCPDWEAVVCGGDDECLSGVKPEGRSAYRWESTGSSLTLRGMDDPHKTYSTSYDVIVVEEAFEFTQDEFVQFRAMLRNWCGGMRFQLLVALTNPRHAKHWLLDRVKRGLMTRYQSKHVDNPKWYTRDGHKTSEGRAYLESLETLKSSNLTMYRRNFLGEWCAADGAVWGGWDEDRHVVAADSAIPRWHCAAMDWGYTDACVLLVSGVAHENGKPKTITIKREIYQSRKSIEWWGERVLEAFEAYRFPALVVDPSRPEIVDYFNRLLMTKYPYLREYPIARPADNARHASSSKGDLAGIDLVRQYIDDGRLLYVRGSFVGDADPVLREKNRACGLLDEIPDYVNRDRGTDEMDLADQTDPNCDDHACDALRYMVMCAHSNDFTQVARRILDPDLPPWVAKELESLGR